MDQFVKIPNLPQNPVKLAVVDERISTGIQRRLYDYGIDILKVKKSTRLYTSISGHPDMQLYHLGYNKIISSPDVDDKLLYQLSDENFEIIIGESILEYVYPYDVAYNAARVGNNLICNCKYCDPKILIESQNNKLNIINVKQGYAKCSICVVDTNAIITSDLGVYRECIKHGIDCLKIRHGYIGLEGLDYGFIGGGSGFVTSNKLAFYGDISLHPDYILISEFLKKYNKQAVALDENLVYDYGTFIPLKEYSI